MNKDKHIEHLLTPLNKAAKDEIERRKQERLNGEGDLNSREKEKTVEQSRLTCASSSNDHSDLEPPWVTIPDIPMGDMFWNMGGGEDVSYKFQTRYRALPESAKEEFELLYPEPKDWVGWYKMISLTSS